MAGRRVRESFKMTGSAGAGVEPVGKTPGSGKRLGRVWLWVGGLAAAAVVGWWWKTGTWPVVAIVEGRPLTRFEVDQALYRQGGEGMVDSLITQRMVEAELDRKGVKADPGEVDRRIEEIRATVPAGRTLEEELKSRGYELPQMRKFLELQARINKAVEDKATVSAEEVNRYITDNARYMSGKTDAERKAEAETILGRDRLSKAIEEWIGEVRLRGRVWRWPL